MGLYLSSTHPSHNIVKLSFSSPVGVVNVPLLAQALTHAAVRARHSEVPVWKLEAAVGVRPAGRLLGAGVVQVGELQHAGHGDKLPGLEVQQSHRTQGGLGQEVQEPDQIQTHLGGERHAQQQRETSLSVREPKGETGKKLKEPKKKSMRVPNI